MIETGQNLNMVKGTVVHRRKNDQPNLYITKWHTITVLDSKFKRIKVGKGPIKR